MEPTEVEIRCAGYIGEDFNPNGPDPVYSEPSNDAATPLLMITFPDGHILQVALGVDEAIRVDATHVHAYPE